MGSGGCRGVLRSLASPVAALTHSAIATRAQERKNQSGEPGVASDAGLAEPAGPRAGTAPAQPKICGGDSAGGTAGGSCRGCPSCDGQELTDVERAIETVISQFHCYAVKGQKEYLTPNEMQELVVQKLPHLGKVRCVGPLEEKIECMGDPNEAKLEFGEYWDMMGDAAKGCRRK
uniref:S100 calcium binding protein A14 n=1 Tax=Catharus ustulatus TaxID=91951 RepID=A0A8C3Y673_CATUS